MLAELNKVMLTSASKLNEKRNYERSTDCGDDDDSRSSSKRTRPNPNGNWLLKWKLLNY